MGHAEKGLSARTIMTQSHGVPKVKVKEKEKKRGHLRLLTSLSVESLRMLKGEGKRGKVEAEAKTEARVRAEARARAEPRVLGNHQILRQVILLEAAGSCLQGNQVLQETNLRRRSHCKPLQEAPQEAKHTLLPSRLPERRSRATTRR